MNTNAETGTIDFIGRLCLSAGRYSKDCAGRRRLYPCRRHGRTFLVIESYGAYFEPIAKVRHDKTYCNTQEYQLRLKNYQSNRIF